LLIVEGPDGAGKTRLIEQLELVLGWPVAPRVVSKDTKALVDLKAWVEFNIAYNLQPVIYDRHRLISEPIYGPVIRQSLEPGFSDLAWLYSMTQQFEHMNPLIIWCLPPEEVVIHNTKDDPDNVAVVSRIRTIYKLYHMAAARWRGPSFVWDYTDRPSLQFSRLMITVRSWATGRGLIVDDSKHG
jgi:hypothetical protein